MPGSRFLDSISVDGSETVRGDSILSGSEIIGGNEIIYGSLSATGGTFTQDVSASYYHGDGSYLTGVVHTSDLYAYLPLSGGTLTNGLTGTRATFTTYVSAPQIDGAFVGNGAGVTNINASNISTGTLSSARLPVFNGDISTTLNSTVSTTVTKLQGNPISTATPVNRQILQWNGTAWVPGSIAVGGSGGGGLTYFLNQGLSAQSPTTNLPLTAHELGRTGLSAQTIVTSHTLSQVNYDIVAGFVSDVLDPNITAIPAGLWDFNLWGYSDVNKNETLLVQALIYKYDGINAPTLLSTSESTTLTDGGVFYPLVISCLLTQTPILTSDRIYVEFRAKANSNNHHVTFGFGGNTPTHLHTTLPSVGGSGLVKVINGIYQTPASLLVDVDVASNAAIAQSKISGLITSLNSKFNTTDVIPVSSGGTGQTTPALALSALSGLSVNGGTMYGPLSGSTATFGTSVSATKLYGTLIDWMTLVRGYNTTPVLTATIAGGDVYAYTYNHTGGDVVYYRYIATDGSDDSFYRNFSNPTLSNKVASKSISL